MCALCARFNALILRSSNAQFGIIEVEQNGLRLKAPKSGFPEGLLVDGHPATDQAIVVDGPNPTKFSDGTLAFFVIRRGDQVALRIKDSQAPTLVEFHGLHWYTPNPRYRIEAEWIPFSEPKHEIIENVVGTKTNGLVLIRMGLPHNVGALIAGEAQ